MWVVFSVGAWLFIASYLEMPVSTTHSCIGGMIGMTWALKGYNCVQWYIPLQTFPWIGGVISIVISWFISPIFSAMIAMIIYGITRHFILRPRFETKRIYFIYPILIGSTITLNTFFIIYKGAKGLGLDKIPIDIVIYISVGSGVGVAILIIPVLPKLHKYIKNKYSYLQTKFNTNYGIQFINTDYPNNTSTTNNSNTNNTNTNITNITNYTNNISNISNISNAEYDRIEVIHDKAEKFDIRTEEFFKFLQVFTAICGSFSHGANDVANAIGPFAAIYTIYQTNNIRENSVMENNAYWMLSAGGVGISLGLLIYGYKIIYAMGTKLCKITPSRGTIISLSSATIIIIGSRLKIPLSTTHCQVGAIVGIGLLEDIKTASGINKRLLFKTAFGWIITCGIVGIMTAGLVLQGVYSPSIFARIHNNTLNCTHLTYKNK